MFMPGEVNSAGDGSGFQHHFGDALSFGALRRLWWIALVRLCLDVALHAVCIRLELALCDVPTCSQSTR